MPIPAASMLFLHLMLLSPALGGADRSSDPVEAVRIEAEIAAQKAVDAARGADIHAPVPASARDAVIAALAPHERRLEEQASDAGGLSSEQRARARAVRAELRTRILAARGLLTAREQSDLARDLADTRFRQAAAEEQLTRAHALVNELQHKAKAHEAALADARRAHDATREELARERQLKQAIIEDMHTLTQTLEKVRQAHADAVKAADGKPKP